MHKSNFLRGAMILTLAGIVVKVLGGINRILLSRLLGGEGIGLYQMAYPIYILFLSIAGAGIPIAVSIMIAEKMAKGETAEAGRVFHIILAFMIPAAIGFGLLLAASAELFIHAGWVRDTRALMPLLILSPALTLSIIACCFRGYFQGLQQMMPTAVSQMADQAVRVCAMLVFAMALMSHGIPAAATGAAAGAVPGAAIGLLIMLVFFWRHIRRQSVSGVVRDVTAGSVIKRLLALAIPVAAANMLLPAVAGIDLFIVPKQLESAGYTVHEATALFGYLSGMANGVIQLPAILTMALATSLVPAVSAAFSNGKHAVIIQRVHTVMRIANVITIPACCGLAVLAVPISRLLYATPAAGAAICVLSISVFLVGVQQITGALLQGMGRTVIPLVNMAIGAGIKIFLSWHLTAVPALGIVGAAWATNAGLLAAALLNLYFARRFVAYRIQGGQLARIAVAAVSMAAAARGIYGLLYAHMGGTEVTMLAMVVGLVIYGIGLWGTKAVTRQDLGAISFFRKT